MPCTLPPEEELDTARRPAGYDDRPVGPTDVDVPTPDLDDAAGELVVDDGQDIVIEDPA